MSDISQNSTPAQSTQARLSRVSVPLEADMQRQIKADAAEISLLLGCEVTMATYLRQTILHHWQQQGERYRKLAAAQQKTRP